jgi:flavin reductase (DIM6/NTAB) family NADH-FMN oxidoreductase RutF
VPTADEGQPTVERHATRGASGRGPAPPVDADLLRDGFARRASAVAVVTTTTDGGLYGFTVTAFCPVSAAPPLVLVSIDGLTRGADLLADSGFYGVSLLGARQTFLADRFAGRAPLVNPRFDDAPYFTASTGAPLLRGGVAWLDCRVVAVHEAGDHRLFVGAVEAAGRGDASAALVYFDRRFHALPLEPDR